MEIEKTELLRRIREDYQRYMRFSKEWRDEAKRAYDYVAGSQFTEEERLTALPSKPLTVFNRIDVFASAITGLEAINREQVRFSPRRIQPPNIAQSDIWNDAANYVNQDCSADTEHSEAFRDLVICGFGWSDVYMDYETNPDGDVKICRIDPLMMAWDCDATQKNLRDRRWCAQIVKTTRGDVIEQWSDNTEPMDFSDFFDPMLVEPSTQSDTLEDFYPDTDREQHDRSRSTVYLLKYQYFVKKSIYSIKMPDGSIKNIDIKEWNKAARQIPDINQLPKLKKTIRSYRQAFVIGNTLLEDEELPVQDGFTLQCMTGKRDRNKNYWFGLVHDLFDPQDWINKLFSEMLYLIMIGAKGGLLATRSAFDDPDQAAYDWADPSKIVWLAEDGINKITPRVGPAYPSQMDNLMSMAMQMFHEVTGINPELLGMAQKVQPGVLEAQRKQAGITILAWAFDSLRDYRRNHGRILAGFIQTFLTDGRLIRVHGDINPQYTPLVKDSLATEYDIVVGESATSVNEKDRLFAILMQLIPNLAKLGIGPPPELLDYLPIPEDLATKWKQSIMQNMQAQQQEMEQKKQAALMQLQTEIGKTQSETELNKAKAENEAYKL